MDPTTLLKKQHREVESLFRKVERAKDPAERRRLMGEIGEKLALHMRIEEDLFYPAVRRLETKKAEEMVLEAYEEHGVVKLVIDRLPEVDPEDERFDAKMTVLSELIEHHVEEEEREMFKLASRLGKQDLMALGDEMRAAAGLAANDGRGGGRRDGAPGPAARAGKRDTGAAGRDTVARMRS